MSPGSGRNDPVLRQEDIGTLECEETQATWHGFDYTSGWQAIKTQGQYKMPATIGDRIKLISKPYYPLPYKAGAIGTVVNVTPCNNSIGQWFTNDVAWDDGQALLLSVPPDRFETIAPIQ